MYISGPCAVARSPRSSTSVQPNDFKSATTVALASATDRRNNASVISLQHRHAEQCPPLREPAIKYGCRGRSISSKLVSEGHPGLVAGGEQGGPATYLPGRRDP